jgi:hypothetical protein
MNYPLQITFKLLALTRQLAVRDADGKMVFYVKQKAFKLKEQIAVFADMDQQSIRYHIRADRVLDFSGSYKFSDAQGRLLGAVNRHGMKSLWRAHYEVADASGNPQMMIREENPWTKVLDGLLGELPFVGILAGYIFNPAYLVSGLNGATVLRMSKQPALFEGKFAVEQLSALAEDEETLAVLALIMMILLERNRG